MINDTYGYGSFESSFFNKDSQGWIPSSTNADFKIGFGFLGELSCLQIMNKALKIAEIKQLALTCYLDQTYFRPKSCPKDFIQMYDDCYKISEKPLTHAEAVVECISQVNDPFVTRLAIPENFQIIKNLIQYVKEIRDIEEIYVGLDSLSGISSLQI